MSRDRSALGDAADTSCLDADLIDAHNTHAIDNGIVTIEDWLLGDPDIDQPLSYRERVGGRDALCAGDLAVRSGW